MGGGMLRRWSNKFESCIYKIHAKPYLLKKNRFQRVERYLDVTEL